MNKYIIGTIALGTAAAGWLLWGNSALTKTHITVESTALPRSFDGFRIAHITDLHNTRFAKLPALVTEAKPDIIAITGDLIDARRPGMDAALDTIQQLLHIAPCYYVMGNHESRIPEYPALETALQQLGVYVLRNEAIELERSGEYLTVIGVDDPSISPDFADTVSTLRGSARGFTLLLSHRPERFAALCGKKVTDTVEEADIAAVLSAEKCYDVVFINQADIVPTDTLAALLTCSVSVGSVQRKEWKRIK